MVDKIHKTILAVVIVIAILAVAYTLVNENYSPAGAVVSNGQLLKVAGAGVPVATPGVSHSILDIEGLDSYVAESSFWSFNDDKDYLQYTPSTQSTSNGGFEFWIGSPLKTTDTILLGNLQVGDEVISREVKIRGDLDVDENIVSRKVYSDEIIAQQELTVGGTFSVTQEAGVEIIGNTKLRNGGLDISDLIYIKTKSFIVSNAEGVNFNSGVASCIDGQVISGGCDCPYGDLRDSHPSSGSDWTCACSPSQPGNAYAYALCLKK